MARKLGSLVNTDPNSSDYPRGRVRDNTGSNDGTPVDEAMVGDILQYFAMSAELAGITFNDLPDNTTNGWEYMQAAQILFNRYKCSSTSSVVVGTGVKQFTVPESMSYQYGVPVMIRSKSIPGNYMQGIVSGYVATATTNNLSVLILNTGGSGTNADWDLNIGVIPAIPEPIVLEIGTWDMDTDPTKDVTHGLDQTKILSIEVMIISDSNNVHVLDRYDGTNIAGGILDIGATDVVLIRRSGGWFDATDYSGSGNRGTVTITYKL